MMLEVTSGFTCLHCWRGWERTVVDGWRNFDLSVSIPVRQSVQWMVYQSLLFLLFSRQIQSYTNQAEELQQRKSECWPYTCQYITHHESAAADPSSNALL